MKYIIACLLIVCAQGEAFTVINQTDKRMTLDISNHKVKIGSKSKEEMTLKRPTSILVVEVIKKHKPFTRRTSFTLGPMTIGGEKVVFDNHWGLVIHKPVRNFNSLEDEKRGYAFLCLPPDLLEKIDPAGGLPKEWFNRRP